MNQDFVAIFIALRGLYAVHQKKFALLRDDETGYFLGSHEILMWNGERIGFGGVEIKDDYVSAHLIPVELYPDMAQTISDDLKNHMHGKMFFNFIEPEPLLFAELADLIAVGIGHYKAEFRI